MGGVKTGKGEGGSWRNASLVSAFCAKLATGSLDSNQASGHMIRYC
jgi:hypothetical protein